MRLLTDSDLFRGISPDEAEAVLRCLRAMRRHCARGEWIYHAGERAQAIGLVLNGAVSIEKTDVWGSRTILDSVAPGQIFAETYACVPDEPLMVDVVATEETDVLLIDAERLLNVCSSNCGYHSRLIRNLLYIASLKNLKLSRRSFYTATRSLRGRLLAYLSDQAAQKGSRSFDIPFDRQQLADYLSVDRSALSNELSRLRREGVLTAERSRFTLLCDDGEGGRNPLNKH